MIDCLHQEALKRQNLNGILEAIPGVKRAYFQPPEKVKMEYPCIVYKVNDLMTFHAQGDIYKSQREYLVTVIDTDPDSDIYSHILEMPYASFDTMFTKDGLNHTVLTLYY